jgi:hypothetical protein
MAEIDKDYLEKRAEAELTLAQAAAHPAAVRAHYLMAGLYLDRLYCAEDEAAVLAGSSPWPGQGRY